MSCKCKNIIENFQGGTIPLDTIFGGNVQICGAGKTLSVENIIGCSPVTIGNDSGSTSGNTTLVVSGSSVFGGDVDIVGNIYSGGTNLLDIFSTTTSSGSTGGGGTFTGNTSATCINELWVSNISGCSPVTIGTELIVNDFMSGKTTTLFGENNSGGGSRTSLTPTLTIFDEGGSGGGAQTYSGPNLRFSDNGNLGDIFYRYNGGGNVLSNSFNFLSDGGFNFIAEGDCGSPGISNGPYFRISKGQSSLSIYDDTTRPRTDVKITNVNGGSAYSRLGVGAQSDYWYIEADDVDTPMHIGYDDNGVDTNVFTFEKSEGLLEGSLEITSGLTADTITLNDINFISGTTGNTVSTLGIDNNGNVVEQKKVVTVTLGPSELIGSVTGTNYLPPITVPPNKYAKVTVHRIYTYNSVAYDGSLVFGLSGPTNTYFSLPTGTSNTISEGVNFVYLNPPSVTTPQFGIWHSVGTAPTVGDGTMKFRLEYEFFDL